MNKQFMFCFLKRRGHEIISHQSWHEMTEKMSYKAKECNASIKNLQKAINES